MTLRFSPRAESDLQEIFDYIAREDVAAAERVRAAILERARAVAKRPHLGLQNSKIPSMRSVLVPRYQYRINYQVRDATVLIVHIRHTARRPWIPTIQ